MTNILQTICEKRKTQIEKFKMNFPASQFSARLTPSDRSLAAVLATPSTSFILECKKASPSKGLIRKNFDLPGILDVYAQYAGAISVLTEPEYFKGRYSDLVSARDRVSQPILMKDFIIDPFQVNLARYYSADAVLLMLSVLDDATYKRCCQRAEQFGLDVLTEISNETEAKRAVDLGAKLIGINNRNLRSLTTNLETTEKLVQFLPSSALIVSESGIQSRDDIDRLKHLVNGFLVGSSLMSAPDLRLAVQQLIGQVPYPRNLTPTPQQETA